MEYNKKYNVKEINDHYAAFINVSIT